MSETGTEAISFLVSEEYSLLFNFRRLLNLLWNREMDSSDSEDVEQSTPPPRVHVRPPHDEMDVTFTLSPPVYSGSFRGCNVPEFPQEHVPKISDTSKPICLVLGIRSPSAKVILSRLVSEGYLVRELCLFSGSPWCLARQAQS